MRMQTFEFDHNLTVALGTCTQYQSPRTDAMRDPTYPLIPVANLLAACILVATLVSNSIRGAHNRGVIMLVGWTFVQDLIMAIHSIVWSDSSDNIAPVFCDICAFLPRLADARHC